VHLSSFQWLSVGISLLTAGGQIFLLNVMVRKDLRKSFPMFFLYNGTYAAVSVFLNVVYLANGAASPVYFYIFWILNTALMLLEFTVMHELFVHSVKPYSGLIDLAKMMFRWAAAFLLLVAALNAFATSGSGLMKCVAATVYLNRGLRLMQCGMLLLFFLFERRLGLSWRTRVISASIGLGLNAACSLCLTFFRARYPSGGLGFDLTENGVYLAVVGAWIACFWLPQGGHQNVMESPRKLIFQRWNDTLLSTPFAMQSSLASASMDSFLPNVERTVERVMARKMTH
jgi:hypothetical protein